MSRRSWVQSPYWEQSGKLYVKHLPLRDGEVSSILTSDRLIWSHRRYLSVRSVARGSGWETALDVQVLYKFVLYFSLQQLPCFLTQNQPHYASLVQIQPWTMSKYPSGQRGLQTSREKETTVCLSERLRRWTANPLCYARVGSNPATDVKEY